MIITFNCKMVPEQNEETGQRFYKFHLEAIIGRNTARLDYFGESYGYQEDAVRQALEQFAEGGFRDKIIWGNPKYGTFEESPREATSGKAQFIVDHLPDIVRIPLLQIIDSKLNAQNKISHESID